MPRTSPVHYIAPSAISITPNANGSQNDLGVNVVRDAKIKVYSPKAGLNTQNGAYQEWSLTGKNRRLSDGSKPYTIYARLPKNSHAGGYLVFAPKVLTAGVWVDKYRYITPDGLAAIAGASADNDNWYVKLGDISLPESRKRTIDLDTGILGTEEFNTSWSLNPDALPLQIDLSCTIDDEDAGPTPYVYWNDSLVLTALLTEGWTGTDIGRFDHWEIARTTGTDAAHAQADAAWAAAVNAGTFRTTGSIELLHYRGAGNTDDFNSAVNAMFTVMAMERTDDPEEGGTPTYAVLKSASICIMAETWEKYELSLASSMVTFNPQTESYSPNNGVKFNVRATDQKGDTFLMTNKQFTDTGLSAQYAAVGVMPESWTPITISGPDNNVAEGTVPATAFSANQKSINVRILNAASKELHRATIAFLRDGEDSKEREWIFLRSATAITFGTQEHPYPANINMGEIDPNGEASGGDTDKNQDGWVPNGWWDEQQGVDATNRFEYGSYRDFVHESEGTPAHWGAFTTPKVWNHWGADGRAVSAQSEHYNVSNSDSTQWNVPSSGPWAGEWGTDPNIQQWGETAKYLWNYEKVTYTESDGSTTIARTTPHVVAIWTKDGANGRGISAITEYYKISASNTDVVVDDFETVGPSATIGYDTKYNLNTTSCKAITFINHAISGNTFAGVLKIGGVFHTGDVINIRPFTQMNAEALASGRYANIGLFNSSRYRVAYLTSNDGGTTPSDSPASRSVTDGRQDSGVPALFSYTLAADITDLYIGRGGGDTRINLLMIEVVRNGNTLVKWENGVLTMAGDDGTWTTDAVSPTADKPYLWNYEEITWLNSDSTTSVTKTEPHVIGHYGRDGEDGLYYVDDYGRASSRNLVSGYPEGFDSTTGWQGTAPATTDTYKYIWRRSRQYDPNTQQYGSANYTCMTGEDGKDAAEVNPNILLRTIFDDGIDKVKEKWTGDWDYIVIDTVPGTVVQGRKSIRLNAMDLPNVGDGVLFSQSVLGKIKPETWYTVSFNAFRTSDNDFVMSFNNIVGDSRHLIYDGDVIIDGVATTISNANCDVYINGDWDGERHTVTFKTRSSEHIGTETLDFLFWQSKGSGGGNLSQTAICMPKLEVGQVATAYMPNEDDLRGADGGSGEDAVNVVVSPASMIVEQDINNKDNIAPAADNNLGRFSIQVLKGSRLCTITSIAATASQVYMSESASTGYYQSRTWQPGSTLADMYLKGIGSNNGSYYSTGQLSLSITYTDPDTSTDKTITSIIAKVYVNLIGSWSEQVEADMKTELANSSLFEIDNDPTSPTYGEVIETENWGEFYRSSTENISRLTSQVNNGKNLLSGVLTGTGWGSSHSGVSDVHSPIVVDESYYMSVRPNQDDYQLVSPSFNITSAEKITFSFETPLSGSINVHFVPSSGTETVVATTGSANARRSATYEPSTTGTCRILIDSVSGSFRYPQVETGETATAFEANTTEVSSQIKQAADNIDLSITNKLGETGIHIDGNNRTIELKADRTIVDGDLSVSRVISEGNGTYTKMETGQFELGLTQTVTIESEQVKVYTPAFRLQIDENGDAVLCYMNKDGQQVGIIDASFFSQQAIGDTWNEISVVRIQNLAADQSFPSYDDIELTLQVAGAPTTYYQYNEGYVLNGSTRQYNIGAWDSTTQSRDRSQPSEYNGKWFTGKFTIVGGEPSPTPTSMLAGAYINPDAIPYQRMPTFSTVESVYIYYQAIQNNKTDVVKAEATKLIANNISSSS